MNNFIDDEIRLKDVLNKLKLLKKELFLKKKVIFLTGLFFSIIGLLYSLKNETIYNANLTFVVENNKDQGGLAKYAGFASQFGFDLGGLNSATFSQSNIIELIKSRKVVQNALLTYHQFDNTIKSSLVERYIDNRYRSQWEEDNADLLLLKFDHKESFTLKHDSILGVFYKDLVENVISVGKSDETSIVTIICSSNDELFSKKLAESLVNEVSEYYIHAQTAQARNTLNFIKNRSDSVLIELKIAELNYARHKDSNYGIYKAEGLIEEIRLQRKVEILTIMYSEIVKNLEISKVSLLNQKPLVNVIDLPILPLDFQYTPFYVSMIIFGLIGFIISIIYLSISMLIKEALDF